jgi:hypothetical protein
MSLQDHFNPNTWKALGIITFKDLPIFGNYWNIENSVTPMICNRTSIDKDITFKDDPTKYITKIAFIDLSNNTNKWRNISVAPPFQSKLNKCSYYLHYKNSVIFQGATMLVDQSTTTYEISHVASFSKDNSQR